MGCSQELDCGGVQGSGFRVQDSGFRVLKGGWGCGLYERVEGLLGTVGSVFVVWGCAFCLRVCWWVERDGSGYSVLGVWLLGVGGGGVLVY